MWENEKIKHKDRKHRGQKETDAENFWKIDQLPDLSVSQFDFCDAPGNMGVQKAQDSHKITHHEEKDTEDNVNAGLCHP